MKLFHRYAVQTQSKLVKDGETVQTEEHDPMETVVVVAAYADILKDVVTHTALTVGGVYAACQIIKRICK